MDASSASAMRKPHLDKAIDAINSRHAKPGEAIVQRAVLRDLERLAARRVLDSSQPAERIAELVGAAYESGWQTCLPIAWRTGAAFGLVGGLLAGMVLGGTIVALVIRFAITQSLKD